MTSRADTSAEFLRQAFNCARNFIVVTDLAGNILEANQACLDYHGYGRQELMGRHISILQSRRNPPGYCHAAHTQALQGHWAGEWLGVTRDGREAPIFCSSSVVRDERGRPVGAIWISQDITESKRAEEALRESEQRCRALVDFCPYAIALHCDGKFVCINPAGLKLLGATGPEQIIGRSIFDFVPPEFLNAVAGRVKLIQERGQTTPLTEQQLLRVDGTRVDVEVTATPFDYYGKPAVLVMMRDISRRKKAEQALAAQRAPASECPLTARQREIVRLLADGCSSKQIAAALNLSVRTVDTHRKNIMAKLGLTSLAALVRYAVRTGIVQP